MNGMVYLGRVRLGSIRNKNNWNNASKRLFRSYSHSGIPWEQNSRNIFRNIFLFRDIPNERALNHIRESNRIATFKKNVFGFIKDNYYMASSASGQDESNPAL